MAGREVQMYNLRDDHLSLADMLVEVRALRNGDFAASLRKLAALRGDSCGEGSQTQRLTHIMFVGLWRKPQVRKL